MMAGQATDRMIVAVVSEAAAVHMAGVGTVICAVSCSHVFLPSACGQRQQGLERGVPKEVKEVNIPQTTAMKGYRIAVVNLRGEKSQTIMSAKLI